MRGGVAPFHRGRSITRMRPCRWVEREEWLLLPLSLFALLALALLDVLALPLLAVVCAGCWLCFSALACNQDQFIFFLGGSRA
jgi:Na+-transporting methylmalonyl-CoA/oxaloacetate decarboxylase beta subunit